jgi:hypothetical protein
MAKVITDYELIENGFINDEHIDEWLELFTDLRGFDSLAMTEIANEFLEETYGYTFLMARAISQDDEGVITWEME